MKRLLLILFFVCSPLIAQNAKVTSLVVQPLPDYPGKAIQILTVEYPPGGMIRFTGTTRMHSSMCWRAVSSWP